MSAVKVKEHKKSILLALLFLALVGYFIAILISNNTTARAQAAENAAAKAELSSVHQEITKNNNFLENANEAEKIEQIAREEYGYAYPDEIVYVDSEE